MAELLETERSYVKDLETAISSFLGPMKTSPDSVPGPLKGKEDIIFGNVEEILGFHKSIFLKELEKYESMPEDVGHCFVTWALKFDSYVTYCTNKPHSTALLVATSGTKYFENLQRQKNLEHPIAAYLIKPVQRITKYQLLLKDLLSCCDVDNEIKDGLEVCLNVPKKANDALHLSMLEGCDLSHAALGEVVLQDAFHIWDPKQIIKKAKDRHIFLFELFLVTSKQVRDPNGKSKYIYKSRMTMSSEMGVTEHIEGDECKFAVWTGRSGSTSENKMILKASSIDVKHNWVKKLRELIQETYFNASLPTISVVSTSTPSTTTTSSKSHGSKHHLRFSREYEDMMEENTSSTGGTGIENMERGSLASFGSGNTTDSDKGCETTWVITDFSSSSIGELSVTRGQQVEILEISSSSTSVLVRLVTSAIPESSATSGPPAEGLVPISVLKQPPGGFRALARHELDHHHHHLHHLHDSNEASNSSSSPVGKKRGFGGRWLPNIRKLSQGKLDKGGGAPSPLSGPEGGGTRHLPLIKQTSKSKIVGTSSGGLITKAPSFTTVEGMGNKSSHPSECEDDMKSSSASASTTAAIVASTSTSHEETEDVDVAEVPPPMQPISSIPPTTSTSSPPEGLDMSECSITDKGTENDSTLVCDSSSNNDKTLKGERSDTLESNDETSNSSALIQRQYRLNELLDSEKMYVKDLEQCCQYINYMKDFKEGGKDESIHMPDDLKEGKDRMIFGNIEAIYEWHRDFFSKNLEKCIQNPIELGNLFKKYDRKFQMYVVYCQNKPKSEYIVSEYIDTYFEEIRMKLGFKLRLTDLLIKPVQRLTKYHMLLEAILKYSQRAGMLEEAEAISRAFHVMTIVPNQANDMMDIGRLQGFEGKITAQGKLLYRGPLSCLDNFSGGPIPNGGGSTAKMKPFTVFLFEQIMIFSETVGKKTQFTSPVYVYVAHFLVNKMSLEENVDDGHPCKFMIRSTDPARDALNIMCQTDEPESRDKWISIIKKQLQTQMDFLRALQAPIAYHNKLAKDYSSYDMNHLWEVVGAAREKLSSSGTVGGDEQQTSVSPPLLQQALKQQPEQHQRQSPPPAASSSMTLDRKLSGSSFLDKQARARRNFLEGFRHTLGRPRTRSDDFTDDKGKFNSKGIMSSYNNNQESDQESNHSSNNKLVKVLIDHEASGEGEISVLAGDMIHILSIDLQRTPHSYYISKTSDHGEELKGWVPTSIINERKVLQSPQTWSYRKFQSRSASSPIPRPRMDHNLPSTEILRVSSGETATLTLPNSVFAAKTIITTWKGPSGKDMSIFQSKKFNFVSGIHSPNAKKTLIISNVQPADAGEYQCLVKYPSDEDKIKIVTFDLQVVRSCVPSRPGQPRIQDLKGSSVVLIWDYSDVMTKLSFTVEYCRLRSGHWTPVKTNINGGLCIIDNLCPGETYSFRILAVDDESVVSSQPSLPSQPLAIPLGGDFHAVGGGGNFQCSSRKIPHRTLPTNTPLESTLWKRDFERKFIELEELGRGRYSVVRRCQEILTGTESAVKFINRRKQDREITKCEYEILNSLKGHPHIVEGFELFLTSSSDAIVMEMIHYSLPLFEVLCQKTHYTEGNIQFYMTQLLKALEHIHSKGIAHLDLKPENLLLQTSTKTLKLIDFGSAQRLNDDDEVRSQNQLSTKGPEFLAPEILSENKPLGAFTDMWGFGVLIYVSLSGLSPFLDDSEEETTSNILRCDFSFPKEYFSTVSESAKEVISQFLCLDGDVRKSSKECLQSTEWFRNAGASSNSKNESSLLNNNNNIPSHHLSTLVRRRMKKLNSVALLTMSKNNNLHTSSGSRTVSPLNVQNRPDSLYSKK